MILGYIKNYIHMFIKLIKHAGWNFDWERSESCQFTKYKLNQYYDWHCDSWDKPYDKEKTLTIQSTEEFENYL